ncbi:MAG: T9SS type A sorting domain-containing protein, partial [Cytophagales bacterium]|nr:T9SS type A sorting domain-containing protein [Cytophagales bacterium]
IVAGYTAAGSPLVSYKNSAFTGAFALAAMANSQTMTNTFYSWWSSNSVTSGAVGTRLDDGPYFQRSLRVLYMLLATGNFWWPCSTGPTCNGPNISPRPTSICGTSDPLTLNAGIAPISSPLRRRIQWFRNGTSISGANAQTFNVYSLPAGQRTGTFTVSVDSLDNTGALVCNIKDSVSIAGSISGINLGTNINLCNPAYTTLSTSITGTGYTYQWATTTALGSGAFARLSDIASATGTSLTNVRTRGLYQLKISASGCPTAMDTISISSSVPTPVDACINTTGSATLSITNPGLGTGPYNWYTTETGNILAAGASTNVTSYTTPSISSTTTYWVQDMSAVSGTVGPTAYLGGTQQWGVSAGNKLVFNATSSFTLNSVSIPFIIYSGSSGSVSVAVQNNSGVVISTATSLPVTAAAGSVVMLDFTFSGFNIPSGSGLQMVITGIGSINGNPLWNDNVAVSYPYNSSPSGIVSITGSVGGNGNPEYMYFYNWKISTGSACGRLPVIAKVGGCSAIVLGLNLADFKAQQENDKVKLEWNTSFESLGGNYQIQRSYDGVNFEIIHQIASQGNFYSNQGYSYNDSPDLNQSEVFYRIIVLEGNKEQVVSSVVKVNLQGTFDFKIYPNPLTGNELNIELSLKSTSRKFTVLITDNLGRAVYTQSLYQETPNTTISFENQLPAGIYYVLVKSSSEQVHQKLVVY